MQDNCRDCLSNEVCPITGGACQKMGSLFDQCTYSRGKTAMTNTAKNIAPATPKDVKEKTEEKTVPAQVQPNTADGIKKDDRADKVRSVEGDILFSGTQDEVRSWLNERPNTTYLVRSTVKDGETVSMEYVEQKPSLVQRAKTAAEKLKKNKKALLILTGAAVVVGLTVKNNRKAVTVTVEDKPEETDEVTGPDDTTDSL